MGREECYVFILSITENKCFLGLGGGDTRSRRKNTGNRRKD